MKYIIIAFFVIWGIPCSIISAQDNEIINSDDFVEDIKEALMEVNDKPLIESLSAHYNQLAEYKIPNCFECSLILIRETSDTTAKKQMIAADFAVKFSPHLPDAHLYRLFSMIRLSPFDIGGILMQSVDLVQTIFFSHFRDSLLHFIGGFIRFLAIVFLVIFSVLIFIKEQDKIIHVLHHITDFSWFYFFILISILAAFAVFSVQAGISYIFIFLIVFNLFYRVVNSELKTVFITMLLLLFISESLILFFDFKKNGKNIDEDKAIYLNAVYNPIFIFHSDISGKGVKKNLAKGVLFFYKRNYERSIHYLSSSLKHIKNRRVKAMGQNMLGVNYFMQNKLRKARQYLSNAYKNHPSSDIAYNLTKILYQLNEPREAELLLENVERRSKGRVLTFPMIYLPAMHEFSSYILSEKLNTNSFLKSSLFTYWLSVILTLLIIAGAYALINRRYELDHCLECGSLICTVCSQTPEKETCVACKMIKANPHSFSVEDRIDHEHRKDHNFKIQHILAMFLGVVLPGGGLIIMDRELEGTAYLIFSLFLVILFFSSSMFSILIMPFKTADLIAVTIVIVFVCIYSLSFYRTTKIWRH